MGNEARLIRLVSLKKNLGDGKRERKIVMHNIGNKNVLIIIFKETTGIAVAFLVEETIYLALEK